MKQRIICKALAVAVILLFLGLAIQPSVAITKDRINHPPGPPLIEGPRRVRPGTYEWSFKSIDSNGDDLFYLIGWGDGCTEEWVGPYPSGEKIKVSHTYHDAGTVCIRARAKDIHGAIGDVGTFDIEISIEPKEYLFQTLIDFANNPVIKNLLEQYDNDLFSVDIDRGVYRRLFLRNPRLMFNTLFSKPSMTVEYLNKCYNNGIRITNILGEDKVLDTIENVEVTDRKLFDELNNIISKDEEISNNLVNLEEFNSYIITVTSSMDYTYICLTLLMLLMGLSFIAGIFYKITEKFGRDSLIGKIISPFFVVDLAFIMVISYLVLFEPFNCIELPYA